MTTPQQPCRCGWNGTGEHLCHQCKVRPGIRRFYHLTPAAPVGKELKFVAHETIGCGECWEKFKVMLAEERGKA